MEKESDQIEKAVQWIKEADSICFFIGAGMSVASGVPTFRGKFGLWTFGKQFLKIFGLMFVCSLMVMLYCPFLKGVTTTTTIILFLMTVVSPILPWFGLIFVGTPFGWSNRIFSPICWVLFKLFFYDGLDQSIPNFGHRFISWLNNHELNDEEEEKEEKDIFVVTQNVDNLEKEGGFEGTIYQLHGNYRHFFCSHCNEMYPNFFPSGTKLPFLQPKCQKCGSRTTIRTGCLLFADDRNPFPLNFQKCYRKLRSLNEKDLIIIIGTSGTVSPANLYPGSSNARIIDINIAKQTAFKSLIKKKGENFMYIREDQVNVFKKIKKKLDNSNRKE